MAQWHAPPREGAETACSGACECYGQRQQRGGGWPCMYRGAAVGTRNKVLPARRGGGMCGATGGQLYLGHIMGAAGGGRGRSLGHSSPAADAGRAWEKLLPLLWVPLAAGQRRVRSGLGRGREQVFATARAWWRQERRGCRTQGSSGLLTRAPAVAPRASRAALAPSRYVRVRAQPGLRRTSS